MDRRGSNGILFPNGSWVTFLLARNVRPDRLRGNALYISWAHGLGGVASDLRAAWMAALAEVTKLGDEPAVLVSEPG